MVKKLTDICISALCLLYMIIPCSKIFGQQMDQTQTLSTESAPVDLENKKSGDPGWANYKLAIGGDFIVGQLPLTLNLGLYMQFRPIDNISIETHPMVGYSMFNITNGVTNYILNFQIYSSLNVHFPSIPGSTSNISLGAVHGYSAYGHALGLLAWTESDGRSFVSATTCRYGLSESIPP